MKVKSWFLNFDFKGRSRRSHYWANIGAWTLVLMVLFTIVAVVGAATNEGGKANPVAGVLFLVAIVASILSGIDNFAMVFRRLHDTGRSGWAFLLLLVPFLNFLALYWILIQDSNPGPNQYGPPVKQFYDPNATVAA